MKEADIKKLSTEALEKKLKGHTTLTIILGILTFLLFAFVLKDYYAGIENDFSLLTIAICTLGGFVSVYPELKMLQTELKQRNN